MNSRKKGTGSKVNIPNLNYDWVKIIIQLVHTSTF
jgi:hypothetical protein